MSFEVSSVEYYPFIRKEINEMLAENSLLMVPTEKYMSELPLPKSFKIEPFFGSSADNQFLEAILGFDVRSDDVFVCSLPKCGSSWMQIIVWLLTHNLDYGVNDRKKQMGDFDEFSTKIVAAEKIRDVLTKGNGIALTEPIVTQMVWNECFNCESPRVIKTHLPVYFLPKRIWEKRAKVIYVVRNPKDMVVSWYHFERNFFQMDITLDDIVDGMTNGVWFFGPHFNHCLNYWHCRHLPNVLLVAYEDLVIDSFANIKKISEFLECKYTDKQLQELTEFVSFNNMRKNKAINREEDVERMEKQLQRKRPDPSFRFMRKGTPGAYRDELNETQIEKFDDWIHKNQLGTDFKYKM